MSSSTRGHKIGKHVRIDDEAHIITIGCPTRPSRHRMTSSLQAGNVVPNWADRNHHEHTSRNRASHQDARVAGHRLVSPPDPAEGTLEALGNKSSLLAKNRMAITAAARAHKATSIAVFGSIARGDDTGRHPEVPWQDISRLTILLAHHYHRVDPDQVWAIATADVPALTTVDE